MTYAVLAVRPWTYSISPTTCIFQNATVCILVILAAVCIWSHACCSSLHAGCSNLHKSVMQYAAACCILHTGVMQDTLRRYAGFICSYAACTCSYCSLHAGTQAACMPPYCEPSITQPRQHQVSSDVTKHCTAHTAYTTLQVDVHGG